MNVKARVTERETGGVVKKGRNERAKAPKEGLTLKTKNTEFGARKLDFSPGSPSNQLFQPSQTFSCARIPECSLPKPDTAQSCYRVRAAAVR